MVSTIHFTCIGKGHGAPAIPATREDWENLRNAPWLAEMCRRIAAGDEALKAKLPVWTPGCAEFKNNHRALADALKPLPRLMLDFDEKGHSAEILAKAMELQAAGKWKILLVEESVRKGTHVLIALPEGMTPQEAQQRFSNDIGFVADPVLKDVASRCIYMVPRENTLYINSQLWEVAPLLSPPKGDDSLLAMPVLCDTQGNGKQGAEPAMPVSSPSGGVEGAPFPLEYDGIEYGEIVSVLEEQMGGKPEHGSRNNFIFSMACHLRYVTNDDPEWIARILPTYGEGCEKWMATIRSACNRNQTKAMPRIMKRTLAICRQRTTDEGQQTADNGQLPPEMSKRLPPLIKLLVSRTPKVYRAAVAHAVFPALGAHLWRTHFRYIDNALHEATLMNVLVGETGAGKNCISEPINHILRDIRQRDMENLAREREWKREMVTKGANKDKRQRPEGLVIQEIDPDMTNAAFVQRLSDADGHFLYTRMDEVELLNALRTNGTANMVSAVLRLAFDCGEYGQVRVAANAVNAMVRVRWNWNASSTVQRVRKYFAKNIADGTLSRLSFATIPESEEDVYSEEFPVYEQYAENYADQLQPYIDRIETCTGTLVCPEATAWVRALNKELLTFAREAEDSGYARMSRRGILMGFFRAMLLYVMNGCQWDENIERFASWSVKYDLWCKMRFFRDMLRSDIEGERAALQRGPVGLLPLLPQEFTRDDVRALRIAQGMKPDPNGMLRQWMNRGQVSRDDTRGVYVKA